MINILMIIIFGLILINIKPSVTINCYSCSSHWVPCAYPADMNLLKYNIEACDGFCYVFLKQGILYRGCSTKIALSFKSSIKNINGLLYNLCSTELCNGDNSTINNNIKLSTKPHSINKTSLLTTVRQVDSPLFCYDCNSNWKHCAEPVNLNAIKYNKKPCRNGSCYSVTLNGVTYRGCTLGTPIKSFGRTTGPIKIKNATYFLCTTNLCNIKSGSFRKINDDDSMNSSTTKTTKYKIYYDENKKKGYFPTRKYILRNKQKYFYPASEHNKSNNTNVTNLVSSTTSTSSTEISTTIITTTTTKPKKQIECFKCNSNWKPCNNPIELSVLKLNKVKCEGSCYEYMTSDRVIYRGCTTGTSIDLLGKKTGFVYYNFEKTHLCDTNLCNKNTHVLGSFLTKSSTTTKALLLTVHTEAITSSNEINLINNTLFTEISNINYTTLNYLKTDLINFTNSSENSTLNNQLSTVTGNNSFTDLDSFKLNEYQSTIEYLSNSTKTETVQEIFERKESAKINTTTPILDISIENNFTTSMISPNESITTQETSEKFFESTVSDFYQSFEDLEVISKNDYKNSSHFITDVNEINDNSTANANTTQENKIYLIHEDNIEQEIPSSTQTYPTIENNFFTSTYISEIENFFLTSTIPLPNYSLYQKEKEDDFSNFESFRDMNSYTNFRIEDENENLIFKITRQVNTDNDKGDGDDLSDLSLKCQEIDDGVSCINVDCNLDTSLDKCPLTCNNPICNPFRRFFVYFPSLTIKEAD